MDNFEYLKSRLELAERDLTNLELQLKDITDYVAIRKHRMLIQLERGNIQTLKNEIDRLTRIAK